jgi:hypothetical protein
MRAFVFARSDFRGHVLISATTGSEIVQTNRLHLWRPNARSVEDRSFKLSFQHHRYLRF